MDTIFAPATGVVAAGVAVIRVSGAGAAPAAAAMAGPLPPPRRAVRRTIADASGDVLDRGLVLWFPAPHSFTGEDVVELHVHGGRAVVQDICAALAALPGLRPAEPGEFTRRAFVNGRLDLTAAEGIADLVAAETSAQRRQAMRQLDGELGRLYDGWRSVLLRALAHVEAAIDFVDEELPGDLFAAVRPEVVGVAAAIAAHLDDRRRGERLRDGFAVAIVGAPNVGKSSLLNRLARRDVAIVAATAGTTRDVVETRLDLGGFPVTVADTAGLREAADAVEAEGVRRALGRAAEADLVVRVHDATDWPPGGSTAPDGALVVVNKADLRPGLEVPPEAVAVSCLTGAGIETLVSRLEERVAQGYDAGSGPPLTRQRHRSALADCLAALEQVAEAGVPELAAEDLRVAVRGIGRITGKVDVEDLLDRIFADFCIGK